MKLCNHQHVKLAATQTKVSAYKTQIRQVWLDICTCATHIVAWCRVLTKIAQGAFQWFCERSQLYVCIPASIRWPDSVTNCWHSSYHHADTATQSLLTMGWETELISRVLLLVTSIEHSTPCLQYLSCQYNAVMLALTVCTLIKH